ncbi:MAG: ribose-5-phosphate isomerase RpiA [Phycisphaerales bacterium JB039]
MSEQQTQDALAIAAIAEIRSGMTVGMGTGRTAKRGIRALAERYHREKLDIRCVSTSEGSEALGRELGLPVCDFATVESLDYMFDGADEIDAQLRMLKGSGGAMTRERMIAWAARRRIYMVDRSKMVDRLGANNPLPIAVMAFGLASIRAELRDMGLAGVCRRTLDGHLFLTDNGNLIVDAMIGDVDLEELADALNAIPGVIDHGLFLTEADEVLVDAGNGQVDRLLPPER